MSDNARIIAVVIEIAFLGTRDLESSLAIHAEKGSPPSRANCRSSASLTTLLPRVTHGKHLPAAAEIVRQRTSKYENENNDSKHIYCCQVQCLLEYKQKGESGPVVNRSPDINHAEQIDHQEHQAKAAAEKVRGNHDSRYGIGGVLILCQLL